MESKSVKTVKMYFASPAQGARIIKHTKPVLFTAIISLADARHMLDRLALVRLLLEEHGVTHFGVAAPDPNIARLPEAYFYEAGENHKDLVTKLKHGHAPLNGTWVVGDVATGKQLLYDGGESRPYPQQVARNEGSWVFRTHPSYTEQEDAYAEFNAGPQLLSAPIWVSTLRKAVEAMQEGQ